MRRLLIVCMTVVIALIAITVSISPMMAAGTPTPTPARPTPQGCADRCWNLTPTAVLKVNTCTGVWSITGTPGAVGTGSVRQYGAGNGAIVVVRNFNTSTFLRFYAIGVVNGNASVYIVNTSSQTKYTFNGTAAACP